LVFTFLCGMMVSFFLLSGVFRMISARSRAAYNTVGSEGRSSTLIENDMDEYIE
jgi:hypothetical protein